MKSPSSYILSTTDLFKKYPTKLIILFIISLFVGSCGINEIRKCHHTESDGLEKLTNQISSKIANVVKHNYGLTPCGFGGRISNGVEMLGLSFFCTKPMEINEGRKLLIAIVQYFVLIVNEDTAIRTHLTNYPFEPKNIEIRIFLQKSNGSNLCSGLQVISACEGIFKYKIDDPNGPLFKTLLSETYEEAVKKSESQKSLIEDEQLYEDAI